jgi:hypothetical protein
MDEVLALAESVRVARTTLAKAESTLESAWVADVSSKLKEELLQNPDKYGLGAMTELGSLNIELRVQVSYGSGAAVFGAAPPVASTGRKVQGKVRNGTRNRNPALEATRRVHIHGELLKACPTVTFHGRAGFDVAGRKGSIHIATTPSGPPSRLEWWFGISSGEWNDGRLSWLILDAGDRQLSFVIPCSAVRAEIESTWADAKGERKVYIGIDRSAYYLRTRSGTTSIDNYVNAFTQIG